MNLIKFALICTMFVDGGDDPDFGFLEQFLITDTKAFVSSSYWAERIIPDSLGGICYIHLTKKANTYQLKTG